MYTFSEGFDAGESFIGCVYYIHNMSYIRAIKKPYGTYYARVEGHRDKDGKVHQRVLQYLGTSPNHLEIPVEPTAAGTVAEAIMSGTKTPAEVKEVLKKLGIELGPGKLKKVSLVYNPPQGTLTLCID